MTAFSVVYAVLTVAGFGCAAYGRPLYRSGLWHAAALAFCVTGFAALAVGLAIHSGDTVCMCLPVKP